MYTISKQFCFEASHQLVGLKEGHQCMRLHGHSYRVELVLTGSVLDTHGFLLDYGDMTPFGDYIKEKLDHHHLNDVLEGNPTAELLARHLYHVAWTLFHEVAIVVRVSETRKTWAQFTQS